MCITIPKQVVSVKKDGVLLKIGAKQEMAATILKVKKGDWVLTHKNTIITRVSKNQARQISDLLSKKPK